MTKNKIPLLLFSLLCSIILTTSMVWGSTILAKTPNDVFRLTTYLADHVRLLRHINKIETPWPQVPVQENKLPRHVLQKTFEVMDKIGRLRKITKMGPITIPSYPARQITPSEVYDMVERLAGEMHLVLTHSYGNNEIVMPTMPTEVPIGKTSNDVYAALWAISMAIDPILGVRGFGPNDVYAQSLRVIDEITFIRQSQMLPLDVPWPPITSGKYPNHALQAAYELLTKIAHVEENLWISPVLVPHVPRRVIRPSEVYDALQIVLAESQRLKFRLGLERTFRTPAVTPGKSPDDIIRNLRYASRLLPDFAPITPLIQYNRADLQKTPNHVFAVASHIVKELQKYKDKRGIRGLPKRAPKATDLDAKHVLNKTYECLAKVNRLRQQMKLGPIMVTAYPIRPISPNEVYDLAMRLDSELEIIYQQSGMDIASADQNATEFYDKSPSDVYQQMSQISFLMDTLLGSDGASPNDVFRLMEENIAEIRLLCQTLNISLPDQDIPFTPGLHPSDVFTEGNRVLDTLHHVQQRAGMFNKQITLPTEIEGISPNDVYNQALLIQAEIIALKLQLNFELRAADPVPVSGKTPSHVYQKMVEAHGLLQDMLQNSSSRRTN